VAQRIRYAGGEFLVADSVANAMLDYALRLSKRAAVELVDVPIQRADRSMGRARLLIGQGFPLSAETMRDEVRSSEGDLDDEFSADDLRRRSAALGRSPLLTLDGDGDGHGHGHGHGIRPISNAIDDF